MRHPPAHSEQTSIRFLSAGLPGQRAERFCHRLLPSIMVLTPCPPPSLPASVPPRSRSVESQHSVRIPGDKLIVVVLVRREDEPAKPNFILREVVSRSGTCLTSSRRDRLRVLEDDARRRSQDPGAHRFDLGLVTLIVTGLCTLAVIVRW